ncbi:MAG TPA: protein kinase [Myxococcaceae bacterium]|nr:protein kinase [Myxococcaceae bacterium]
MLAEGTPIGKYVVRRKIAEGGMAEIYLASSRGPEGFEKDVAIKRIRPFLAGDEQFVQMFIAEARVASRLNHANLVQVFEFDKHQDTFYLAMELVRGHSLWDVRRRAKEMVDPMSPTLVAHVGAEVARGLGYAHRLADKGKPLNLVHRDVTPHNVLLSFDGAVKLADFGVAKHSASSTAAGVLKGKFAYMSPEQSRGEALDGRTDLFALGIVLWENLTGGRLFDGDSDVAVLRAVQSSAIAPPSRLNPDVPEALSAVVMKALERDPAQRYQDGQEMERALAGFVLSHAKSVDDTDLGAYLRKLYAEELAQEARVPAPEGGAEPPPRKEPTAQVGAAAAAPPQLNASPDEDMHAATNVVERSRPKTEVKSNPSAPTLEMPAMSAPPGASPTATTDASAEPAPTPVRRSSSSLPKVIADLSTPAGRGSGPKAAPPMPPATMAIPATPRRPRATVGMRRALMGTGLLAVGIAAAAITIVVSQSLSAPAGEGAAASAPEKTGKVAPAAPDKSGAAAPNPVPASAPATPEKGGAAAPNLVPASAPATPEKGDGAPAPNKAGEPGPVAATTPDKGGAAAANTAPEATATGALIIRVRPYASVSIDGKHWKDVEGSATRKLPAGAHKVRLDHTWGSYETTVNIRAGKDAVVEHEFRK